jgi:hypothetical protein
MYTDKFIKLILECEKQIVKPTNRNFIKDRGQLKKVFTLVSTDEKFSFKGFIRQNAKFNENFTIGLYFTPRDKKETICILRCNGPHGPNFMHPHHSECHIHFATAETINKGKRPERNIRLTEEYATLDQAIQYYINKINLNNNDKIEYFGENNQLNLEL